MRSIAFPTIFNRTTVNLVEDYDATLQNLKMLLWSEKNELFGDPYYGTGFKRYLYDQNDVVLQDILIDDIYSTIKLFTFSFIKAISLVNLSSSCFSIPICSPLK